MPRGAMAELGGCGPPIWYLPESGQFACDEHKELIHVGLTLKGHTPNWQRVATTGGKGVKKPTRAELDERIKANLKKRKTAQRDLITRQQSDFQAVFLLFFTLVLLLITVTIAWAVFNSPELVGAPWWFYVVISSILFLG
jgi:hypothetical protein